MTAIYEALAAVMADVNHVAKRDINQHQRFNFRGIDAVVNAVGPVLRKHKVVVVPDVESVAYDSVNTSTGKPATACRVVARYVFYAVDGSSIETRVAAEAWDNGDKAAPKAMSVAFRTALLQALALPTDEPDPDAETFHRAPAHQAAPPPPAALMNDKQRARLHALVGELGIDRDKKLEAARWAAGRPVESTSELTTAEAAKLIDFLDGKRKERANAPADA